MAIAFAKGFAPLFVYSSTNVSIAARNSSRWLAPQHKRLFSFRNHNKSLRSRRNTNNFQKLFLLQYANGNFGFGVKMADEEQRLRDIQREYLDFLDDEVSAFR